MDCTFIGRRASCRAQEDPPAISAGCALLQTAPTMPSRTGMNRIASVRKCASRVAAHGLNPVCRINGGMAAQRTAQGVVILCAVKPLHSKTIIKIWQAVLPAVPCINLRIIVKNSGAGITWGTKWRRCNQAVNLAAWHLYCQPAGRCSACKEPVPSVAFGHLHHQRRCRPFVRSQRNRLPANTQSPRLLGLHRHPDHQKQNQNQTSGTKHQPAVTPAPFPPPAYAGVARGKLQPEWVHTGRRKATNNIGSWFIDPIPACAGMTEC